MRQRALTARCGTKSSSQRSQCGCGPSSIQIRQASSPSNTCSGRKFGRLARERESGHPLTRTVVGRLSADRSRDLQEDRRFRIRTRDGQCWIDPYTASVIPIETDWPTTAKQHLRKAQPWLQGDLQPARHLLRARWRYDLQRMLPKEPRLRLFMKDGPGWMNPWTGELVEHIEREDGRITGRTIEAMADYLATCAIATKGDLLERDDLKERFANVHRERHGLEDVATVNLLQYRDSDMLKARDVQSNMFVDPPELPGWTIAVHYEPHSAVGGDFYDFHRYDDGRLLVVLGDVTGHGVQAALVVVAILKALRMLVRDHDDLADLLTALNNEVKAMMLPGQFATVFAGVLDPATGELQVALTGHHQALLLAPDGPNFCRMVGTPGVAIGLLDGPMLRGTLQVASVTMAPGDELCQFSDGYIEVQDRDGNEYGLTRLAGRLLMLSEETESTNEAVTAISREIVAYGGQVDDDLTMLAIARWADDD